MKLHDEMIKEELQKIASGLGLGEVSETAVELVKFMLEEKRESYNEGYRAGIEFAQKVIKS